MNKSPLNKQSRDAQTISEPRMCLTKEQWEQIEKELGHFYGSVKLVCDGYKVHAVKKQISDNKLGIVVYVDGLIDFKWSHEKAEQATKFWRESKSYLYSVKQRTEAANNAKKRSMAFMKDEWNRIATAAITTYQPWWSNPKDFTRKLRKTCTAIEIFSIGGVPGEVQ